MEICNGQFSISVTDAIQEWLRLHLSSTAVYKEFNSINEGRFVRGKKERSIRKFLRFAHTSERHGGNNRVYRIPGHRRNWRRIDRSGRENVGANLAIFKFVRPNASKRSETRFGRSLGAQTWKALCRSDR